jgi:hypothetical protein
MENMKHLKSLNEVSEKLTITTDEGDCSFSAAEVKQMHDYLTMYFYRSQMNGFIEIDLHERCEIKKMLRLPENCR